MEQALKMIDLEGHLLAHEVMRNRGAYNPRIVSASPANDNLALRL
jgi:hypothetical protein